MNTKLTVGLALLAVMSGAKAQLVGRPPNAPDTPLQASARLSGKDDRGGAPGAGGGELTLEDPVFLGQVAQALADQIEASLKEPRTGGPGKFVLSVNYPDTLLGYAAMYAVRGCAGQVAGATTAPELHETLVAPTDDVVLRLFDVDGREVSRFVGSRSVCTFAQFAATYAARVEAASGSTQHE